MAIYEIASDRIDKIEETTFILVPGHFLLLICLEYVICGRKVGRVNIVDTTELLQKVLKVFLLSESGKLRDIIETHID